MASVLDEVDEILEAKSGKDKPKEPKVVNKSLNGGAPGIIVGERGDRPFSFSKFLYNVDNRDANWEYAKTEKAVADKFKKALIGTGSMLQGYSDGDGRTWLPMDMRHFGDQLTSTGEAETDVKWIKGVMNEGLSQSMDIDEWNWMQKKGMFKKADNMSAYNDPFGGTLVAPPTQGEVIPLIRPEAAVSAAGASQMTLPPSGRFVRPRLTTPTSVTAVPEAGTPLQSDLGTNMFQLTAKKIVGYVNITDEASMFTNGTMDNWVRQDLNKSLGLQIDAYAMYGSGGTNIPAGITSVNYSGTNQVINFASAYSNARGILPNGNILLPQYCDGFEGLIGERSFNMDSSKFAYIMRPGVWASVTAARADAVTAGDNAGPRVDILRQTQDKAPNAWATRKVVRSTNVQNTATKGTGTGLSDVFFGIWEHMVVASYGAIQFQEAYVGNNFLTGVKTLKATMYGDVGLYYPGAFGYYAYVQGNVGIF